MKKEHLLKISVRYGLVIFAALVGYFFLMKLFDLIRHQELRAINGVIIFIGVVLALIQMKKDNGNKLNYFNGIGYGILTSLFAVGPFAIFVIFYLNIDTSFLSNIQQRSAFGDLLNPYSGALVTFVEGLAAGMISSFIVMPYFKTSTLKQMNAPSHSGRKVVTPSKI